MTALPLQMRYTTIASQGNSPNGGAVGAIVGEAKVGVDSMGATVGALVGVGFPNCGEVVEMAVGLGVGVTGSLTVGAMVGTTLG